MEVQRSTDGDTPSNFKADRALLVERKKYMNAIVTSNVGDCFSDIYMYLLCLNKVV